MLDNQLYRADLHTHTNVSDGMLSPHQLIDRAYINGVKALSITDHDTVGAYTEELYKYAENKGIELIPGIEFSTHEGNERYHILGLFIEPSCKALNGMINQLRTNRLAKADAVLQLLEGQGWSVDRKFLFQAESITKTRLAEMVLRDHRNGDKLNQEFGEVPSFGNFIEAWLTPGKPCYVEDSLQFSPEQAINVIHEANGIALLAHPSFYFMKGHDPLTLCQKFEGLGIDGFEAINIQVGRDGDLVEHRELLTNFAREYNLVVSGGSDFHAFDHGKFSGAVDVGFANHSSGWIVTEAIVRALRGRYQERKLKGVSIEE